MTGDPGDVPPLARVVMHDVHQHGYRAYPLADHVADKACAIFERHGPTGTPSTRYKDLVDLVAIVLSAPVEAGGQNIVAAISCRTLPPSHGGGMQSIALARAAAPHSTGFSTPRWLLSSLFCLSQPPSRDARTSRCLRTVAAATLKASGWAMTR